VLADLLDALGRGDPVDLPAWQARYPSFAAELADLVTARREVGAALPVEPPTKPGPDTRTPGAAAPLRMLGDYELLEELGKGGMGCVYKARQRRLGRLVALKVIRAGAPATEADRLRFRTEADAAARLDHPNIVPIYEVGEQDGVPYIAARYVEGGPLSRHLERFRDDARAAASLLAALARAVHHAHQRGVLHRDLKPGNILLEWRAGPAGAPVPHVADFGLARLLDRDSALTQPGDLVGTPSYMAPEQAGSGGAGITTATDIHGLGAILYALLTGRPPFAGRTTLETLKRVIRSEPDTPRRLNPRLDRDLETICLTCLAKDPRRRYVTAQALAEDLENWLGHRPIGARPASARERVAKWVRRHPARTAFAALFTVMILAVLAGSLWHTHTLGEALADSDRLRQEGLAREAHLRDLVYVADMRLAKEAWDSGDLPRLAELLDRQRPAEGETDRRGFEWYWLKWCRGTRVGTLTAHDGGLLCASVSPDNRFLVTADRKGAVKVWDLASRQPVCALPGHSDEVQRAVFSADGRTLATCSKDRTVKLWDVATWSERACLRGGHSMTIMSVAFSPDGKLLASAGRDRRIVLWDLVQGRRLRSWQAHDDVVHGVVFTPDGHTLVSVGKDDRLAKLWDVASGAERARWSCAPLTLLCAGLSPNGKMVATGGYGDISLLSTDDPGAPRTDLAVPGVVRALAFAPSGKQLVATGGSGMFRTWDTGETAREARPIKTVRWDGGNGRAVLFARGGALLVTASEEDGTVEFWDPARLPGSETISPLPAHVMDVALSPDGRGASVHSLGQMCLLDLANRRMERTLSVPPEAAPHARAWGNDSWARSPMVAFSPDGQTVAMVCEDHRTRIWDVASGRQTLTLEHGAAVNSVAFSPTGRLIATVGSDHTARLWELPSGAAHAARASPVGSDMAVAFTADGGSLAVAGFDRSFAVTLCDLSTATQQSRLADSGSAAARARSTTAAELHTTGDLTICAVAFSPDDAMLAAGCSDGVIRLWDIASGDLRQTFSGHVGTVTRIAFTPDGRRLASLGEDNVVNLWHLGTGQRFFSLDTRGQQLRGLAFSRDGRLLVAGARSATKDGPSSLLLWGAELAAP
jgi:WD40 repeat protein/tRNA A-37 threonylcarbamoyl transferase component Bud32